MPDWNQPPEDGQYFFRKAPPSADTGDSATTKPIEDQANQSWKLNRSRAIGTSTGSVPRGEEWLTPEEAGSPPISRTLVVRLTWAATLFTAFAALLGCYFVYVFYTPKRLPLVHLVMGDYGPTSIGRNPFDAEERGIWGPINTSQFGEGIEILSIGRDQTGELATRLLTEIADNRDGLIRTAGSKDRVVRGGGPSGKARIWMISAIAAVDDGGDGELKLLRVDNYLPPESQTKTESLTSRGVPLSRVLRQIAEGTPDNEVSVVLLDLRSPPVVMDFHHLAPAWETLLVNSLSAGSPITDRLLVGIAAGDNEINWAAHELGAGVFTYFIEQALRGNADSNRDGEVTWGELKTYVSDEVQRWAARRRNASQTPRWVIPTPLQKSAQDLTLFKQPKPHPGALRRLDRPFLEDHIGQLERLWGEHAKLGAAYRDSPVQWGLIESNLILLHEMLERKSITNWSGLVRQVEESFADLKRPRVEPPATSLHERPISVQAIDNEGGTAWNEKLREIFEASDPEAADSAPNKDPLPAISDDHLAWLCWTHATGRKSRAREEQAVYDAQVTRLDRGNLSRLLDFYQQHRPVSSMKSDVRWQELHLLTLLNTEVDWFGAERQNTNRDTEEAALDLCQCFDLIMEVSGKYGPQCHLWTDTELQELEVEFLKALDELFASRPKAAKDFLRSLRPQLLDLTQRTAELKRHLEAHVDAQYELGHLLAWIIQGYLIADDADSQKYEDKLRRWRRALELTETFSGLCAAPAKQLQADHPLLATGRELASELDPLRRDWNDFVDGLANLGRSENSEYSFRRLQIALKNPLTQIQQRQELYRKMADFLDQSIDEKPAGGNAIAKDPTYRPAGRTVDDALQILWNRQGKVRGESDLLRMLYSGRLSDASVVDADPAVRQSVYRQAALAMGHRFAPPQRDKVREDLHQWQDETNCRYWETQGRRLVRMAFGDGFQTVSAQNTLPYFHSAASRYLHAIQIVGQRNRSAQAVAGVAESALQKLIKSKTQYLQAIRLDWGDDFRDGQNVATKTFGPGEKQIDETIKVTGVTNDSPPMKAALYMRANRDVSSRIPFSVDRRVIPLNLELGADESEVQQKESIDTESFQGDASLPIIGTLALRGHHYVSELKYREAGRIPVHEITFVPSVKGPTRLVVDAAPMPPIVNVMILLDCSGSMEKSIKVAGGDKMLMEAAKEEAIQLLERLHRLERDNLVHVNVGLIPFGIGGDNNWRGILMEKYRETPAGQVLGITVPEDEIVQTKLQSLRDNANWKTNLVDFLQVKVDYVDEENRKRIRVPLLSASGNTPLYLAIDRAFKQLGDQGIQHVVVISDGGNSFKRSAFSADDLVRKLNLLHGFGPGKDPRGDFSRRLTILMFENPPIDDWEREVYRQGMHDLKQVLSKGLPNQYSFFSTANFAKFRQELQNLIPQTKVVVSRASAKQAMLSEGKLKDSLELNLDGPGPSQLAVNVEGFLVQTLAPMIPVYQGDQVRLTLGDDQRRIEWMEWKSPRLTSRKSESHVFTLAEPRRDATARRVDFLVDFEPLSPISFETRPAELLCRVQRIRAGRQDAGTFNVWDHDFEFVPGKTFPLIRIAQLPWFEAEVPGIGNSGDNQGIDARVTLWIKNTKLPEATLVDIKPDDEKTVNVGNATFRISHRSDRVVVTAKTAAADLPAEGIGLGNAAPGTQGCFDWIVRSSSSSKVTRRFAVDGSQAWHTLHLSGQAVGQRQVTIELRSFQGAIAQMDAELTFKPLATPR